MQADKKNIAWIEGSYHASYDLLNKIKHKYQDAEYYWFDSTNEMSQLINAISTESIFSSCKIVIISAIPDMTDGEKKNFKDILLKISDKILLIFFLIDSNKQKAIFSAIENKCKHYAYETKIPLPNVQSYITKKIENYKIELGSDEIAYLVGNLQKTDDGKHILADTIEMCLRKLLYLDMKRSKFTKEDILLTSSNVNNFIIWDLFAACDNKDMTQCQNAFFECNKNHTNAVSALNEMMNVFAWKFRMLLGLKEKIANKCEQKEAVAKISSIRKLQFVGVGMKGRGEAQIVESGNSKGGAAVIWNAGLCQQAMQSFYNKTPQIEKYSRKELYVINECIQYVMIQMRGCTIDAHAYLLADILFGTICNFYDREQLQKLRIAAERMNAYG